MEINTRKNTASRMVTMISNWDLQRVYKNNVPNRFVQRLVEPLVLNGDWEVAITDISFPLHCENVPNSLKVGVSYMDPPGQESAVAFEIPHGYYASPQELGDLIVKKTNDMFASLPKPLSSPLYFRYNFETARSTFGTKEAGQLVIQTHGCEIFDILGFTPIENHKVPGFFYLATEESFERVSPNPPTLTVYEHMLVNVDIIEPQYVGDMATQQIGRLAVNCKMSGQIDHAFPHLNYVPLNRTIIDTIELSLFTELGEPYPTYGGHVFANLHFRKRGLLE